MKTKMA